ncbi:MAG: response regulator [Deltaproteobacteria bacterium]|nr:response regulator [Deltaproteobacteria bacterium]
MNKVLVVDDEEDIRVLLSTFLITAGYDVVTAKDGEEGIRLFDQSGFDIVITDLAMPLYDGNEVARYIRNNVRRIPVIGISGTPEDMDRDIFDIVLEKPFSLEELIRCFKAIGAA